MDSMSEEWSIHKVPATQRISREMLGGDILPALFRESFGFKPMTPDEREEWERERAALGAKNGATMLAFWFAIPAGHALGPILRLHAPNMENVYRPTCEGCDSEGFESEAPEWPCRTVRLACEGLGIEPPVLGR